MSRIDEALRRLTGGVSPDARNPASLDRFASEGEVSHKANETRRQARIEPRKLTPVALPTPVPRSPEPRTASLASAALDVPPKPVAAPPPRAPERPVEHVVSDGEVERLIDVRQFADYAGFVLRSVGRHKALAAGGLSGSGAVGGTGGGAVAADVSRRSQAAGAAERGHDRAEQPGPCGAVGCRRADARRGGNGVAARQPDLARRPERPDQRVGSSSSGHHALQGLADRHGHRLSSLRPEDKLDALVWRLETYMIVNAGPVGDGTVTIELYWPDGEMAYRLVERARQAFLDARQEAETSAISESITILEGYSRTLRDKVDRTLGEMARSRSPVSAEPRAP